MSFLVFPTIKILIIGWLHKFKYLLFESLCLLCKQYSVLYIPSYVIVCMAYLDMLHEDDEVVFIYFVKVH